MDYSGYLCKSFLRSIVVTVIVVSALWVTLYSLTDFGTIAHYFWIGLAVCMLNTWIANLRMRKVKNLLHVERRWVVMAGVVLSLYHAGFADVAVFVAATIFASPFFGATIYEGIVGLSLLMVLAQMIF